METIRATKKGGGRLTARRGKPRGQFTTGVMAMKKGDTLNFSSEFTKQVRNAVYYTTREHNYPNRLFSTFSDGHFVFVTRKK